MKISVFTDGSCLKSKIGGWAYLLICTRDGQEPIYRAYMNAGEDMTNQRAELLAVVSALENFTKPANVTIYSDSAYIVNCFQQCWYAKWELNGYVNSEGKPVANQDLWKRLLALALHKHHVTFEKVKGHAGHPLNEYVDKLAATAVSLYQEGVHDTLGVPYSPEGAVQQ